MSGAETKRNGLRTYAALSGDPSAGQPAQLGKHIAIVASVQVGGGSTVREGSRTFDWHGDGRPAHICRRQKYSDARGRGCGREAGAEYSAVRT